MSQQKSTRSVKDLASLPPRMLQAALKASEDREAEQSRRGQSKKRKLSVLGARLRRVKEELGEESTDSDESEDESEEEWPAKRKRKPPTKAPVASTSASSSKAKELKVKELKVMSKRDSCTWCRSHERVCVWNGIGTGCSLCKMAKRGCDRWTGDDSNKPIETEKTRGDLEKFAGNLERRLERMEKIVDRIGEEIFGPL